MDIQQHESTSPSESIQCPTRRFERFLFGFLGLHSSASGSASRVLKPPGSILGVSLRSESVSSEALRFWTREVMVRKAWAVKMLASSSGIPCWSTGAGERLSSPDDAPSRLVKYCAAARSSSSCHVALWEDDATWLDALPTAALVASCAFVCASVGTFCPGARTAEPGEGRALGEPNTGAKSCRRGSKSWIKSSGLR